MEPVVRELTDLVVGLLDGIVGPRLPTGPVFAVLCPRLEAPGAVLQCTDWRTGATMIIGSGFDAAQLEQLVGATHRMRAANPLLAAAAAGDLAPMTAQEAAGGWQTWRRSPARGVLDEVCGWDQAVSLPLRGGPAEVCGFAFGRARRDFTADDLELLATVQPVLRALDRHVRLLARLQDPAGEAPDRAREAGLTGRETAVLLCLADGLTAGAAAHRLGCSVRTVTTHAARVYRKLGVHDRLTAVLEAQRRGILPTPAR
ncbi:regulatory LuxR family protein [Geodermatophilus normandii]|uniref:Regulatory LuxR family protein n=1 Tax=Geodermatophilus normandii TaxID=1137989 RepID=A0A317QLU9_9ACTN|nr:helix-turn-helix transcriptional regulator [Geodermatophilus normandii]PWW24009.1 regulatory LuxR family protein [Geodermatophilus normandii]